MKDKFTKFTTDNIRTIINRLEYRLPGDKKYRYFYKYINFCLKNDFDRVDKNLNFTSNKQDTKLIPYKFWVMWWQGLDDVHTPLIIKKNVKRLQELFGKENVVIITKDNFKNYTSVPNNIIKKLIDGKISFTHWSDIVRFNLLRENGGYWVDSTVMMSPKFKDFIVRNENNQFISVCENSMDYHNISFSQWTTWFIGGVPHYDLFEYICVFYNIYFKNHEEVVDYFLLDDVIAHYYQINSKFKNECKKNSKNWYPYYWIQNFTNKYNVEMEDKFNLNINYSIQKLTYKFDSKILEDHTCLAFHILNQTDYYERNSK